MSQESRDDPFIESAAEDNFVRAGLRAHDSQRRRALLMCAIGGLNAHAASSEEARD